MHNGRNEKGRWSGEAATQAPGHPASRDRSYDTVSPASRDSSGLRRGRGAAQGTRRPLQRDDLKSMGQALDRGNARRSTRAIGGGGNRGRSDSERTGGSRDGIPACLVRRWARTEASAWRQLIGSRAPGRDAGTASNHRSVSDLGAHPVAQVSHVSTVWPPAPNVRDATTRVYYVAGARASVACWRHR